MAVVVWLAALTRLRISCGVPAAKVTGISGHVEAKHLGCYESPLLLELRTRHSRPTKSWLQTGHVAALCGMRCGCVVVYVRVGSTILRRCRLALLVVSASVAWDLLGPGCDASPMRTARSPYLALRMLFAGVGTLLLSIICVVVTHEGGKRGCYVLLVRLIILVLCRS